MIRTIVKPTGKPVDVADGITWYLNPKRAIKFGDGKPRQLENKTAGVLRTDRTVADPLGSYDVRIFVRGCKVLSSGYTTAMMNVIDVSAPIDE
ncbi:MAG TPA: hypothetical protein EYQ75_04155, partial [Planctomycetaceae bacterium]|nr:hypothetical protein [Planctomycetaceae bacterium]